LDAAIAAAPKEKAYRHQLAVAKTQSGDTATGLALFTEIVGAEKAHYNVAYLLTEQGKNQEAARLCRVALAMDPNFEAAYAMLEELQPGSNRNAVAARQTGTATARGGFEPYEADAAGTGRVMPTSGRASTNAARATQAAGSTTSKAARRNAALNALSQ
jgi:hypothetical protein